MADSTPPSSETSLASAIQAAKDGKLTVSYSPDVEVNAEEFVYIERDCNAMKAEISQLQRIAQNISHREVWGLGESTDGMFSANTVVNRFRAKAKGFGSSMDSDNNVYDILQKHHDIIDDIQTLHHIIAQQYIQQDEKFGAEYNRLNANLPASPIRYGNPVQPGVTAPVNVGADR